MSSLIEFKSKFLVYPFGLYNNSIICYFNSLIQTLLSCTSITEYLLYNEEKFKNNNFITIYITILKKYIQSEHHSNFLVDNNNLLLFNEFLQNIKIKNNKFGYDQEDSGELLIILLDIINDTYINNLFLHKYKCDIYCKNCKNIINIKNDTSIFFEVDINEINNNFLKYDIDKKFSNLNKFIRNNYSELDAYECLQCKNSTTNIKINRLTIVPTIIIINLNKYKEKYNFQYPIELYFVNQTLNNCYKYKIISTINHSGTQSFGHYIAKSIRKNHEYKNYNDKELDIYLLNDTSYQKDNFKSTPNSYLLFYHYIETVDYYE
jgi:ubiquitin C-terminal hydrolase